MGQHSSRFKYQNLATPTFKDPEKIHSSILSQVPFTLKIASVQNKKKAIPLNKKSTLPFISFKNLNFRGQKFS